MSERVLASDPIYRWIDQETTPLDLVASWTELCDTYESLRFTDELSDSTRLEEFKWIIHQMNTFLKNIRKQLMTRDCETMLAILESKMATTDTKLTEGRKALVYQSLRQRWVINARNQIMQMMVQMEQATTEMEEQDGWASYGID